jgi:hypothetical protein
MRIAGTVVVVGRAKRAGVSGRHWGPGPDLAGLSNFSTRQEDLISFAPNQTWRPSKVTDRGVAELGIVKRGEWG